MTPEEWEAWVNHPVENALAHHRPYQSVGPDTSHAVAKEIVVWHAQAVEAAVRAERERHRDGIKRGAFDHVCCLACVDALRADAEGGGGVR